jgi:hypothetical protein
MPQSYDFQSQTLLSFLTSSLEIALFAQSPQGTGTGTEFDSVSAPGYERIPIAFTPALNLCATNTGAAQWTATGDWPVAFFFGICLVSTGDLIYWGAIPLPGGFLTGKNGSTPTIPAGKLLLDWTNPASSAASNWGPSTGFTPIAGPGAISLASTLAVPTDLDGMPNISGFTHNAIPQADAGQALFLNISADQTLGSYLFFNVIDATRGSTAGYTIAGPNSLAF